MSSVQNTIIYLIGFQAPDRRSNLKDIDAESARKRSVAETVLVPSATTYFDVQATAIR